MCYISFWILQKRRSARNTHRKKYVDDIMLSISDDDSPKEGTPKQDTSKASSDDTVDPAVKPNFVYIVSINTVKKVSATSSHIEITISSKGILCVFN